MKARFKCRIYPTLGQKYRERKGSKHWDKNTESAKGANGCVRLVGNNSLAKKVKSINQNRKNLLAPLLYKQFITQAKKNSRSERG